LIFVSFGVHCDSENWEIGSLTHYIKKGEIMGMSGDQVGIATALIRERLLNDKDRDQLNHEAVNSVLYHTDFAGEVCELFKTRVNAVNAPK
jgi:hypothetical protein